MKFKKFFTNSKVLTGAVIFAALFMFFYYLGLSGVEEQKSDIKDVTKPNEAFSVEQTEDRKIFKNTEVKYSGSVPNSWKIQTPTGGGDTPTFFPAQFCKIELSLLDNPNNLSSEKFAESVAEPGDVNTIEINNSRIPVIDDLSFGVYPDRSAYVSSSQLTKVYEITAWPTSSQDGTEPPSEQDKIQCYQWLNDFLKDFNS